jgi:putative hydrolase
MRGVSPGPGDDPFGEGDPFKGVPIFGDLARMFQGQGPVSWDAARQLALSIATGGQPESNVDPADRIRLEQIARVAELHVANATGLDTSHTGRGITVVAVTRGQWAQKTLSAYAPLIERLAGSLADASEADEPAEPDLSPDLGGGDPMAWMAPLMKMVGPMMLGMTAGSMVGHLATRTFGQYDLPLPRAQADELMVVPANLDAFGQDWSLPADDLRLWVCLHEIAHHAVLGVPHVRQRLEGLLARYAEGFEPNPESLEHRLGGLEVSDPANLDIGSLLSDPEIMLGAVRSPGQHELVPQIEALVATIAGYVDHVMDQVGNGLIGSYGMLSEALRRRRVEASQADRFVEQLFGVELTQAQYERGERFVAGVVERAGAEGLARLWESAETLPTPAEVDAPGLWLARIELPTD